MILLGFTPKVGSLSRVFFAALFQLVHSPGVRIAGTNSALIRLKSQLLPKLLMIVFNVPMTSSFTNLTSVHIPSSVTKIDDQAFMIISKVQEVHGQGFKPWKNKKK